MSLQDVVLINYHNIHNISCTNALTDAFSTHLWWRYDDLLILHLRMLSQNRGQGKASRPVLVRFGNNNAFLTIKSLVPGVRRGAITKRPSPIHVFTSRQVGTVADAGLSNCL